jgi:hypothetical protein
VDEDARALRCERASAGRSDSARRAGDYYTFALKPGLDASYATGARVHVSSDMEGVAGIVKWEQGRRLYTEEINAAVREGS